MDDTKPKLKLVETGSKPVLLNEGDIAVSLSSQIMLISRADRVEELVNNHVVNEAPHLNHNTRQLAHAYQVMEMRYLDMIHRHEPWRAYDNHLFVNVNYGFPEDYSVAEAELDKKFALSDWDRFSRRLQAIVQRVRKTMDSWGNSKSVGHLWALERESDDFATYQVKVDREGQEPFGDTIYMFEPSDNPKYTVMVTPVLPEKDGQFETLAKTVYLSDAVDPHEQMMRLTILFTQGHLMTGLFESFRDFNS